MPLENEKVFHVSIDDLPAGIHEIQKISIFQRYLPNSRVKELKVKKLRNNGIVYFGVIGDKGIEFKFEFQIETKEVDEWLDSFDHYKNGKVKLYKKFEPRVRLAGDKGFLTFKGPKKDGSGPEFEYEIPYMKAKDLFLVCRQHSVIKDRYPYEYKNFVFEIDVFKGLNDGLILVEVEYNLGQEDQVVLPPFMKNAIDVTDVGKYGNVNLSRKPFKMWR